MLGSIRHVTGRRGGRLFAWILAAMLVLGSFAIPARASFSEMEATGGGSLEEEVFADGEEAGDCLISLDANGGFFTVQQYLQLVQAGMALEEGMMFGEGDESLEEEIPRLCVTGTPGSPFWLLEESLPIPQSTERLDFAGWSLWPDTADGIVAEDYLLEGDVCLYAIWDAMSATVRSETGDAAPAGSNAGADADEAPAGSGTEVISDEAPAGSGTEAETGNPVEQGLSDIDAQDSVPVDADLAETDSTDPEGNAADAQEADSTEAESKAADSQGADPAETEAKDADAQEADSADPESSTVVAQESDPAEADSAGTGTETPSRQPVLQASGRDTDAVRTDRQASAASSSADADLCQVTFEANGGYYGRGWKKLAVGTASGTSSERRFSAVRDTFEAGEEIDLDDYEPETDGWEDFKGWSLSPNGAQVSSSGYVIRSDVTFYALWERDIRDADISLGTYIDYYTGKAKKPAVAVVYDGVSLQKGTDFTVAYSNNIHVGTATATITGKGKYEGTVREKYPIRKAAQSLTIKSSVSALAAGRTVTVKAYGAKGSPKITFSSSDTSRASIQASTGKLTAKKPGTVTIKAAAAATADYKAVSISIKIKILPAVTGKLTLTNQKKGIRVTWKKVAGATGYILFRDGKKIKTVGSGSTISYLDTNATVKGRKYTYKVYAKASTGTSTLYRSLAIARKSSGSATASGDKGLGGKSGIYSAVSATAKAANTSNASGGSADGTGTGTGSGGGSDNGSGTDSQAGTDGTGICGSGQSGENDMNGNDTDASNGGGAGSDSSAINTAPSGIRYCLEDDYVDATLASSQAGEIAVIDFDGVSTGTLKAATGRGVVLYGYLNAGALEDDRSYYNQYKSLRLAAYDGWEGEYWVDVTKGAWATHLMEEAKDMKSKGATGIYLDNTDILYMVESGFREENTSLFCAAPTATATYNALRDIVKSIQESTGLIVMPNGGDTFVKRFVQECPGIIREVNQEAVLYDNNKAQSSSERSYYTSYLDWCKGRGVAVRGIEYINTQAGAQEAIDYYAAHGWQSIYISRHTCLMGD